MSSLFRDPANFNFTSPHSYILNYSTAQALLALPSFVASLSLTLQYTVISSSLSMATIQHEVPEWEAPSSPPKKSIFSKLNISTSQSPPLSKESPGEDVTSTNRTFSDRWLPHWCAYMGRSRKNLLCSMLALFLLMALILGLGLGIGLTHRSWVNLNTFHPGTAI